MAYSFLLVGLVLIGFCVKIIFTHNSLNNVGFSPLALEACSSNADAPVIIFVSKVFWVDKLKNAFSTIVFPKDAPKIVP